jgi:hypothetical protein
MPQAETGGNLIMTILAEPQSPVTETNLESVGQVAQLIDWRLAKAQKAVARLSAKDESLLTPLGRVVEARDQAKRYAEAAELDAEMVAMLLDDDNRPGAGELLEGRLTEHIVNAQDCAARASAGAERMTNQIKAISVVAGQVRTLLRLTAEPGWQGDQSWLNGTLTRVQRLTGDLAQAEADCSAAREAAVMAAAHTVEARVARGLAESDLEKAELNSQLVLIEAFLAAQEEA